MEIDKFPPKLQSRLVKLKGDNQGFFAVSPVPPWDYDPLSEDTKRIIAFSWTFLSERKASFEVDRVRRVFAIEEAYFGVQPGAGILPQRFNSIRSSYLENGISNIDEQFRLYLRALEQPDETLGKFHRTIKRYHSLVSPGGGATPMERPFRDRIVSVGGKSVADAYYVFAEPHDIDPLLGMLERWLIEPCECIITHSALFHAYFEAIHPFSDGNGRVGRMLLATVLSWHLGFVVSISKYLRCRRFEYMVAMKDAHTKCTVDRLVLLIADCLRDAAWAASTYRQ